MAKALNYSDINDPNSKRKLASVQKLQTQENFTDKDANDIANFTGSKVDTQLTENIDWTWKGINDVKPLFTLTNKDDFVAITFADFNRFSGVIIQEAIDDTGTIIVVGSWVKPNGDQEFGKVTLAPATGGSDYSRAFESDPKANKDLSNVVVGGALIGSILKLKTDGSIEYSKELSGIKVAIGENAGINNQGNSIAIGVKAGMNSQTNGSIAIGFKAGSETQGLDGIAIGTDAGMTSQGNEAIAIGRQAGQTNQPSNSIHINSSGFPRPNPLGNEIQFNTFDTEFKVNKDGASINGVAIGGGGSQQVKYTTGKGKEYSNEVFSALAEGKSAKFVTIDQNTGTITSYEIVAVGIDLLIAITIRLSDDEVITKNISDEFLDDNNYISIR